MALHAAIAIMVAFLIVCWIGTELRDFMRDNDQRRK